MAAVVSFAASSLVLAAVPFAAYFLVLAADVSSHVTAACSIVIVLAAAVSSL